MAVGWDGVRVSCPVHGDVGLHLYCSGWTEKYVQKGTEYNTTEYTGNMYSAPCLYRN